MGLHVDITWRVWLSDLCTVCMVVIWAGAVITVAILVYLWLLFLYMNHHTVSYFICNMYHYNCTDYKQVVSTSQLQVWLYYAVVCLYYWRTLQLLQPFYSPLSGTVHAHLSCSSAIFYQLPLSLMVLFSLYQTCFIVCLFLCCHTGIINNDDSILPAQFTCLIAFLHNLSPRPL